MSEIMSCEWNMNRYWKLMLKFGFFLFQLANLQTSISLSIDLSILTCFAAWKALCWILSYELWIVDYVMRANNQRLKHNLLACYVHFLPQFNSLFLCTNLIHFFHARSVLVQMFAWSLEVGWARKKKWVPFYLAIGLCTFCTFRILYFGLWRERERAFCCSFCVIHFCVKLFLLTFCLLLFIFFALFPLFYSLFFRAVQRGYSLMPVDAILLASRVQATKESPYESAVKRMIVSTPGVVDGEWEKVRLYFCTLCGDFLYFCFWGILNFWTLFVLLLDVDFVFAFHISPVSIFVKLVSLYFLLFFVPFFNLFFCPFCTF